MLKDTSKDSQDSITGSESVASEGDKNFVKKLGYKIKLNRNINSDSDDPTVMAEDNSYKMNLMQADDQEYRKQENELDIIKTRSKKEMKEELQYIRESIDGRSFFANQGDLLKPLNFIEDEADEVRNFTHQKGLVQGDFTNGQRLTDLFYASSQKSAVSKAQQRTLFCDQDI